MKRVLIWIGLILVLAGVGWSIWSNERILADGRVVLLELAPVDPRSLMQGDYMALDYAISRELGRTAADDADGYAVVRPDEHQVARLLRTQAQVQPLAPDEIAIRYRMRKQRMQIATNAFFFQEGRGEVFAKARYGEFRVGNNGEPRLTAMVDADFKRLGNNRY